MKVTAQNIKLEFSSGKTIELTPNEYEELKSWLRGPYDVSRLPPPPPLPLAPKPYDITCLSPQILDPHPQANQECRRFNRGELSVSRYD